MTALTVRLGILWYSGSLFRESPEVHIKGCRLEDHIRKIKCIGVKSSPEATVAAVQVQTSGAEFPVVTTQ